MTDSIAPDTAGSDAIAAITLPAPTLALSPRPHASVTGPIVPLPAHLQLDGPSRNSKPPARQPRRRNAAPVRQPRRRNAAPPGAPRPNAPKPAPEPTAAQKLAHLGEAIGGAGLTSVLGAGAVRVGIPPLWVTIGLGAVGALAAMGAPREYQRRLGAGAVSAASSQLLLQGLAPAPPVKAPTPTPPPSPPARKNVDLGTLPPGMLDAAFERARAELAIAGDGYPQGYEPPLR